MNTAFRDPAAANGAVERLAALTGVAPPLDIFQCAASPDQALLNLERWLRATSSPGLQFQQLMDEPDLGQLLILLLGASQPIADSLIQNPELASLIFDRTELATVPSRQLVEERGRILLSDATSYSHALDRLRFLRQRWMLPIVVNDLARTWPEPVVWKAISEVGEALVALALDVVWEDQKQSRGLDGPCPIMVVGFGKLGGGELNYSSDVDLVYVFRDGGEEMRLSRVCEALTRALTDRMGRGQLFRVDLRLRPYGGSGPVACSMRAVESYYELYAEPWEVQALLRSNPVAGPAELCERWETMRLRHCFKPKLASEAIEQSLASRERSGEADDSSSAGNLPTSEAHVGNPEGEAGKLPALPRRGRDDIKRGVGGIRDVEFIAQILQLVHGYGRPALQVRATLDALGALEAEGVLDHAVSESLRTGYIFLRQLEHRIQFVGDQQTHTLPATAEGRERLANLLDFVDWEEASDMLGRHRRTIGSLYQSILNPRAQASSDRTLVAQSLGPLSHSAFQWFDVLPESQAFYASLVQNRNSLERVSRIVRFAPRLVPLFKASVTLTELLLSGEIEEEFEPAALIEGLPVDASPKVLANAYGTAWARLCARWVISQSGSLCRQLTSLATALIRHCARRLYSEFDIIGLGSLGLEDMTLDSDADIILFVSSIGHQRDAETHAHFLLGLVSQVRRLGGPIELDLRLRPEGGKGLLVRTYEGFGQYELEAMEVWERFALGQSRLILGSEDALRLVQKAAYAQPLTPERLQELLAMKKRIETERVLPQHMRREVKLGLGGLADIEWFVHLHEMRYPTATKAGDQLHMDDRIRALGRAALINAIEVDQLLVAREHLQTLRLRLGLHGLKKDLLPENPDKLDRLAASSGFEHGNAFLAHHEHMIDSVRAIYQDGLDRLKA